MQETPNGRYPDTYKQVTSLPKINNTDRARHYFQHGYQRERRDLLAPGKGFLGLFGKKFNPTPEEALQIYHEGKAERYALSSVIASRVIDRASELRSQREPYGLIGYNIDFNTLEEKLDEEPHVISWIALPEPFHVLNIHMLRTLAKAHEDEIDYLDTLSEENPNDPASRVYQRLAQWADFYNTYLPVDEDGGVNLGQDAIIWFNRVFTENITGLGTATENMTSLLRVIPQVCERELPWQEVSPDLLTEIARNSFPFLAKQAMLPMELQFVLNNLSRESQTKYRIQPLDRFNPWYFTLKDSRQGYRVDIIDSLWEQVEYEMAKGRPTGAMVTTGCPAMIDVDHTGSAIRKLWDWHIDIAENLFHTLWSTRFEPTGSREARYNAIKTAAEKQGLRVAGIHF